MRYLESKFSVGSPGTQAYADAWDRIFKPSKNERKHSSPQRRRTQRDMSSAVGEGATSDAVTVELPGVYEERGVAGKVPGGGVGLPEAAPSSGEQGAVSGFLKVRAGRNRRRAAPQSVDATQASPKKPTEEI